MTRWLAVILLLSSPSLAETVPLPPAQYDKPYKGKLRVVKVPRDQVISRCGWGAGACAYGTYDLKACTIVLPSNGYSAANLDRLRRHEIGHCNGWPAHHPGGRQ